MFNHRRDLQFACRPDRPDLRYADRLEHVLADQYHEIHVATHYLSGWTAPVPGRYRDTLVHLGVDQVAMVEMLATMIARLLEGAPAETVDQVMRANPVVAAVMGGTDLESTIVSMADRQPEEPAGVSALPNPWRQSGTTDRQNLVADFLANAHAERDHRPAIRDLRDGTDDPDIRLLLSCLLARTDEHRRECATAVTALTEEPEERVYPGKTTSPRS
ncbi:manganese catalase family protein [Kribbella sp. NPDC055110]